MPPSSMRMINLEEAIAIRTAIYYDIRNRRPGSVYLAATRQASFSRHVDY